MSSPRLASGASRRRSGDGVATRGRAGEPAAKAQPGGAPAYAAVPWRRLDFLGAEGCHLPRFDINIHVCLVRGVSGCLGFTPRLVRAMGAIGKRRGVSGCCCFLTSHTIKTNGPSKLNNNRKSILGAPATLPSSSRSLSSTPSVLVTVTKPGASRRSPNACAHSSKGPGHGWRRPTIEAHFKYSFRP